MSLALKGEEDKVRVKKGRKACLGWKMKNVVEISQFRRGAALQKEAWAVVEEKFQTARRAEATTSTMKRQIVTWVPSEVRRRGKGSSTMQEC